MRGQIAHRTTRGHGAHGPAAINVVSGWFKDEYTRLGLPWLEHGERYRRSAEFMDVVRKLFTEENIEYRGNFYTVDDFTLRPGPYPVAGRPHPEIFQGGNSSAARINGGKHADWYFSNGKDFDGFRTQLIGTPEQVAARIIEYKKIGVDPVLTGFLHFQEELEAFGKSVIPIVREKEAELIDKGLLTPAGV